ncbi:MAG TPA: 16S rRNA (guanine(527)-N(7))-methyltransferase RsmG [Lentimicrobium sp.]|nr:16S rRNA (guanine(527)-N(7))-methyltransferase RsmG [Lentimicrobium sp.]
MEIINKYFPDLDNEQIEQFNSLESLYSTWNKAINVISRKDIDNLYVNHVLHSLSIAKVIRFAPYTSIIDVGTGGGFPGIPLAIMFPKTNFHLVDSIGKKIKVVEEISKSLNLKNVTVEQSRIEDITFKYDFIISRAVTNLPDFVKITKKNITKRSINPLHNGILYLKGGEIHDEIKATGGKSMVYHLSRYFEEPFFETKYLIHLWF